MIDGDIIVIDQVEDDSYDDKDFKKVTDKAGNKFNVKSGRGGALKEKWPLLQEGVAIKLQVGEFNGKPFVKDFTVVEDEFVAKATETAQTQVKTDRNDSIEAQVAFKGMVELIATGMIKTGTEEYKATIEWAMSRLHSVEQIMAKIEEAEGETTKTSKDDKADNKPEGKGAGAGQDSDEMEPPKTAGEFMTWLSKHGIKAPRALIEVEYGVKDGEVLTIEKCQELYRQIREDKKWGA